VYVTREQWSEAVASSEVRLQWDPDHDPHGDKVERRAIQLGLKGEALQRYAEEWIAGIEDISAIVAEQRSKLPSVSGLSTPRERVFPVHDREVARRLLVEGADGTDTSA